MEQLGRAPEGVAPLEKDVYEIVFFQTSDVITVTIIIISISSKLLSQECSTMSRDLHRVLVCLFVCCLTAHQHYPGH